MTYYVTFLYGMITYSVTCRVSVGESEESCRRFRNSLGSTENLFESFTVLYQNNTCTTWFS